MQHVNTMKTKFMEMWDGLATPTAAGGEEDALSKWVLVIAATNKPWALDPAVLRRMPRQLYIGLPDAAARAAIVRVMLRHERAAADLDVDAVAAATEGYSGSDLRELVRAATLMPIREAYRREARDGGAAGAPPRPITTADMMAATASVKATGVAARSYRISQSKFATSFDDAAGAAGARYAPPAPAAPAAPTAAAAAVLSTPKGASPTQPGVAAGASPSAVVARAFLEFGHSSRANSASLCKAVEAAAARPAAPAAGAAPPAAPVEVA